jgi:hypothetical protein
MSDEELHIYFDCSIMQEFIDAAVYAIETGQLTEAQAFDTLLEFAIAIPKIQAAE